MEPANDFREGECREDLPNLCGAKTRSGSPCRKHPAIGKRRCRMHGGGNGSGAQPGNQNGLKHGRYSLTARQETEFVKELLRTLGLDGSTSTGSPLS